MVDLVEHHQRAPGERAPLVHLRCHADLGVRQHRAVEVGRRVDVGVAEPGVELDPDPSTRRGPLVLEVLGRRHDGDGVDRAVGEQFGRDPQRERRLTGARGRHRQEVRRPPSQVRDQRLALPGAQVGTGVQNRARRHDTP